MQQSKIKIPLAFPGHISFFEVKRSTEKEKATTKETDGQQPIAAARLLQQLLVDLKVLANGRNIVGQQHATLMGPTCCVRLHGATTMLALVAHCLKPVKLLGPCMQTEATLLAKNPPKPPTTHNNVVTCCVRLHGPF